MQSDSYMYHRLLDLKMATIYRELYLFVCLLLNVQLQIVHSYSERKFMMQYYNIVLITP